MQRRNFIIQSIGAGLATLPAAKALARIRAEAPPIAFTGPQNPVYIYNNWSAYDELSDNVPQTETLALRQLDEIVRLKQQGVRFDYYVMDAFWFSKDGGYRTWHTTHWPHGPHRWLERCKSNGIKPGMWFSTNLVRMGGRQVLGIIPEWQSSLGTDPNILCLFDGGYLPHLARTLQHWYDQGVRLFKFDFAYFEAVTPRMRDKYTKAEVIEKNKGAFMQMLQDFRGKNRDILITGYNGFGGDMENTFTPFDKKIDPRWLQTFDSMYCGDPRFSDTPMFNIWRSADHYSDHQAFAFKAYGVPVRRIDNCAFMIGTTGTCYARATQCWKGMAVLELARGGWVNVLHGNLELLSDADARWLSDLQGLFLPLQQRDTTQFFGSVPGKGNPYGFKTSDANGEVFVVVNPSQSIASIELPTDATFAAKKVLFRDAGFVPLLEVSTLTLGSEQLTVVGTGGYAREHYDLGVDESIKIPAAIRRLDVEFKPAGRNKVEAELTVEAGQSLRIEFQQFYDATTPCRTWGGAPPDGTRMNQLLKIEAVQNGQSVALDLQTDKKIWSGLSWASAQIPQERLNVGQRLTVSCSSAEKADLVLKANMYEVIFS